MDDQYMRFLDGLRYPASKNDLLSNAEKAGADADVMDALRKLPDQIFETADQIREAIANTETVGQPKE